MGKVRGAADIVGGYLVGSLKQLVFRMVYYIMGFTTQGSSAIMVTQ